MLSDLTSYQHNSPRCGHCGSPLPGRFARCPSCLRSPADSLSARSTRPPALNVRFNDSQPIPGPRLPVRKTWRSSSRALVNVYDTVEDVEAIVIAAPLRQRLRRPVVLGISMLAVTFAVYLGFVHGDDLRVGTPVAVSGKVQAQNVKPLAVLRQKPAVAVVQKPVTSVAQKPVTAVAQTSVVATAPKPVAVTAPKPVTAIAQTPVAAAAPKLATTVTQKPVATVAQKPATTVAQKPATGAVQNTAPVDAQQQPATVATARSAPVGAPPGPPAAARRVTTIASVAPVAPIASVGPEATHNPGSRTTNQPDKPRVDVSRHIRAARVDLQLNNLTATKARLAAAIAAQPDNRDALNMRSTVNAREQQRDALLSLARGCGYIARWSCVAHNAGIALNIDSSSKEAQRLVARATRETQLQMPPSIEPAADPTPESRDLSVHH